MQVNMSMKKYSLMFTQLAKYASLMVANFGGHIIKFMTYVSGDVAKECRTGILCKEIDIYRLIVHC